MKGFIAWLREWFGLPVEDPLITQIRLHYEEQRLLGMPRVPVSRKADEPDHRPGMIVYRRLA